MNNAVYSKAMEKLRNRINVKLLSHKKDILKWTSKPSYISQTYLIIIWWQFVKTKLY